jgi:hypothetical protein
VFPSGRNLPHVVIHTGHLVAANHYRGVWHDNSGQCGDFELRIGQ